MRIDYKPAGSAGAWIKLGDESDRSMLLELFAPSFANLVQSEPLFRAADTFKEHRTNPAVTLQLTVSIPYATLAAALESINTLRSLFRSGKLHLKISQGATEHFYPNAINQTYTPQPVGVTVRHTLTFTTDDLTTTEPS